MAVNDICIFGDSIGKGVVLQPDTNRYRVINMDLENILGGLRINIKNYAKFGCTVSNMSVYKTTYP